MPTEPPTTTTTTEPINFIGTNIDGFQNPYPNFGILDFYKNLL
jgi:hypothetical protein